MVKILRGGGGGGEGETYLGPSTQNFGWGPWPPGSPVLPPLLFLWTKFGLKLQINFEMWTSGGRGWGYQ